MGREAKNSPRFFRVIIGSILQEGTLELPRSFVKEHRKGLSKHACLRVPTGAESKIKLKKTSKGRAWLLQGWQDFVDKYSIQCGYFLVFKYQGRSLFNVRIFDWSTWEIQYPSTSKSKQDGPPMEAEKNAKHSMMESTRRSALRDRVVEKAKAFWSPNLHFVVIMYPTYMSNLNIPVGPARSLLIESGNNWISLKLGANGRSWLVKYTIIGTPSHRRVKFFSGWHAFCKENLVKEGDACGFELVNSSTFHVTLFRIDEEIESSPIIIMSDKKLSADANKAGGSSDAMNPHFQVCMTSSYLSARVNVHIPLAHSRRYLKKDQHVIILHGSNAKTWAVKLHYSFTRKKMSLAKGWKDFVADNFLRIGDVCKFELMIGNANAYKVSIHRVADGSCMIT